MGGIGAQLRVLSEGLVKNGVEVDVYTTEPGRLSTRHEVLNGVKIRRYPALIYADAYFISPHLLWALRHTNADLVHAHGFHDFSTFTSVLAKKTNRARLVSTLNYHGQAHTVVRRTLFYPYKKIVGEYVISKTDLLVCPSEYEYHLIENHFGSKTPVVVIPPCIELFALHKDIPSKREVSSTKKILYVGRLESYKGVQYIIEAVWKLNREEDIELRILGGGPYESELRNLVNHLGLSKRVFFLGRKSSEERNYHYLSSDVVVLPSQRESFNLVAIEALACGTPVISTPVGEPWRLIREGLVTGISNPQDTDELKDAIRRTLSRKYDRNMLRQTILAKYSPEQTITKTMKVYSSLLAD